MIAVVESMVAAPLVAMGVTHPEGHDLLGKSEQAIMLLLGVFIRPSTMIIGLILSITLTYIMVGFFNYGFVYTLNPILEAMDDDPTSFQLVTVAGSMIVYAYVIIEVINQCFSIMRCIAQYTNVPSGFHRMISVPGFPRINFCSDLI